MEMCFVVLLSVVVGVQSVYVPKLDAIWMKRNGKLIIDMFMCCNTTKTARVEKVFFFNRL